MEATIEKPDTQVAKPTTRLSYCLYARKSSESDERQAMSIDSQLAEMRAMAEHEGLNVVCELQESHSAKESGQRPVYNELMKGLRGGTYNAVLTWAPDRLSRNAGDLGSIVDLMDQGKLLHIRTYSQTFTNNPNEKFLLMILCSQAKLENDNKSINVKRGIKAKCEMGWRPGVAPLGYMNRAFGGVKDIIIDPDRSPIIKQIFHKAGYDGWSGRRLLEWSQKQGLTNRSGENVVLSQIYLILNNTFYYGEFEYHEGDERKTYIGKHEPLITKELFDLVRDRQRTSEKGVWGAKKFAFKGIFKCGNCGADITAEEKFKSLKDGGHTRHVYYHCTKQVDRTCPEKYVNENLMIKQLIDFIDSHETEIAISESLQDSSERHLAIITQALESHGADTNQLKPLHEYAKFILNKGSYNEKASFVLGINGTFTISNRTISAQITVTPH